MLSPRIAVCIAFTVPLSAQVTSDPVFKTISNVGVYGTNQGSVQYKTWYSGNQNLVLDTVYKRSTGSFNNNGYVSLSCYRNNGFPTTSVSTYCNCPLGGITPYHPCPHLGPRRRRHIRSR